MRLLRSIWVVAAVMLFLNSRLYSQHKEEQYYQTIRGTILDKDLQSPLASVSVVLMSDTAKGTRSDDEGKFRIEKIPVGRHELKISLFGYKEIIMPVLVSSGKEVVLTISMEVNIMEMEEIVISVEKDKSLANNNLATVSATNLRAEEINRFAGSRQDPSRMASNYAGVAGGGDQRNDIIVRGNSPIGVLWRLEGVDIPNPNHFTFTGNTGGAFSILNNTLLANSDFLTGAFPAEYGNKTAAVFDVRLRKGNNEKREHTFQIGLNGIELATEGPISKKTGASYMASYRLFTFEALNKLGVDIGANGIPQFQNATVKIDLPTEKAGTFSLWGIGGKSSIDILDPVSDDSSNLSGTTADFASDMHAAGISNMHFWNEKTFGKLTLSVAGSKISVRSSEIYKTGGEFVDYELNNKEGHYLVNYTLTHKLNVRNLLKTGVTYRNIYYNNKERYYDFNDSTYRESWDQKGNAGLLQSYVHWQFNLTEKLVLNSGLYHQLFMLNNTQSLEPRLAAAYSIDSKQRISMAVGLHSQMHDLFVYQTRFYDATTDTYYQPNKDLKFTKSLHAVAGYQRAFTPNLRFKTEVYYQYLYNVPVSAVSHPEARVYSILNTGADYEFFVPDSVVNQGKGNNYGMEFSLERYFNKDYYFLSNLSLLNSKYKGYDKIERNTAFNIGHIFNFLAGKEFHLDKLNRKIISADVKVTYSGGRRIIGVDKAASISNGYQVLDYNNAYNTKVRNYFRTDVKISYNINRSSATHNFFIAADNVFNTQNVLTQGWDNEKNEIITYYQLGIFPYLGYRVQF
jgi:hypothetical protein